MLTAAEGELLPRGHSATSGIIENLLRQHILHDCLITDQLQISSFQQGFFAIENNLANIGLNFGIGQFMLATSLLLNQLNEVVSIFGRYGTGEGVTNLEALHGLPKAGIDGLQLLQAK